MAKTKASEQTGQKKLATSFKSRKTDAYTLRKAKGKDSQPTEESKTPESGRYSDPVTTAALKAFDLDPTFGPCAGLTRRERWQRAESLGLNPPPEVWDLLENAGDEHKLSVFAHI
mmetsp:Transcript_20858/g.61714  ORF Transcript_20858/g.61714 Transcript_20858/m.61714 type:complete len:115 (-) Transcript_20858:322-666(-)|eukprot:CAMPEP_0206039388 /NCGR_PEP_ID=MMETSP1466-20131121/4725_1 /ASSEMBLY_ACC=CAM_ASM_001126 /TAXON_ID=44452 /ORGANISM="Pavlova gyrans, Strain CCMP608" /LENGTH=114 /DNA_ID=CAMNT_0053414025 /DNA_START=34 /DNA_END=378 /DNA_ORIENTATION=-